MSIESWYRGARLSRDYDEFSTWIQGATSLIKVMVKSEIGLNARISIIDAESIPIAAAAWDGGTPNIVVNKNMAENEELGFGKDLYMDMTVALGVIIHEIGHILWSYKTIPDAMKPYEDKYDLYQIHSHMFNVVEDHYVEYHMLKNYRPFSWMLEAARKRFLSHKTQWDGNQPTNMEELGRAVNDILLWRNSKREFNLETEFALELWDLYHSVLFEDNKLFRTEISIKITNKLIEKIPKVALPAMAVGKSSDDGDDDDDIVVATNTSLGEQAEDAGSPIPLSKKKIADGEPSKARVSDYSYNELSDVSANVYRPSEIFGPHNTVEIDKRWDKITKQARLLVYGGPRYRKRKTRGTKMDQLYRLTTDGRVFSKVVQINSRRGRHYSDGYLHIYLLVDASGSMMGKEIEDAVSAAYGSAKALRNAGHKVAVYAHTAQNKLGEELVIYKLCGINDSLSHLYRELSAITNSGALSENMDGHAIEYMRDIVMLVDKYPQKRLIVFSDGSPSAYGYGGSAAWSHTSEEIQKTRRAGIPVVSVSIGSRAQEANDEIYGREYNLHVEDSNAVSILVEKLL